MSVTANLLCVRDLCVDFRVNGGHVRVLDHISLQVARGETLALVGESGCGKSITAQALMRILPEPLAHVSGGSIQLAGQDLVQASERRMRKLRGGAIGMIFQEPMSALNPVLTIGEQLAEGIQAHRNMNRRQALVEAQRLLDAVHIADAARKLEEYPHRLSGGMRQRVVIAMALACRPDLLIADEPTTALDVIVQAQIMRLLREARDGSGMGMLLITHNLGLVAEIADRVAVMYAGRIVEEGTVADVLLRPAHPYTRGLLAATPRLTQEVGAMPPPLSEIPGMVPAPQQRGEDCTFAARCAHAVGACRAAVPKLEPILQRPLHRVACPVVEQYA